MRACRGVGWQGKIQTIIWSCLWILLACSCTCDVLLCLVLMGSVGLGARQASGWTTCTQRNNGSSMQSSDGPVRWT